MNVQPLVSIVILNWNGKSFLQQFLPSVLASTYQNKKIIVADNASTDDSIIFLKENFPTVEIIINQSNQGFAKGYNTALAQIKSDYFVLLNNDVEVTPGWIEPIINLMKTDDTIAVCQPKILSFYNKHQFEYAGAAGGWLDAFGYPFSRGRIFDIVEDDNGQYDTIQQCFWASGAAFFIKAKVFNELRGLDEYMFAHQEEIDLCWRIQLAGYKVYVQPASIIYHVGGGTLPHGNSQKVFLNFRNNLVMLAKNLPLHNALWKIPFRLMLDAVAAYKALFNADIGYFKMIFKAHLYFAKWIILDKKQSVFPISKKGKLAGLYQGSIVWEHFIKKKKSFSKIVDHK